MRIRLLICPTRFVRHSCQSWNMHLVRTNEYGRLAGSSSDFEPGSEWIRRLIASWVPLFLFYIGNNKDVLINGLISNFFVIVYTPPNAATHGFSIFDDETGKASHIKSSHLYSVRGQRCWIRFFRLVVWWFCKMMCVSPCCFFLVVLFIPRRYTTFLILRLQAWLFRHWTG